MWIRTVNGLDFFEVGYTSQGIPYIIPKKKQLITQSGGGIGRRYGELEEMGTPRSQTHTVKRTVASHTGSNPVLTTKI